MSFTVLIDLNGEGFEFCFENIETTGGKKFFVIAKDENGNSYSFNMKTDGETWRIVDAPKVPDGSQQMRLSYRILLKEE